MNRNILHFLLSLSIMGTVPLKGQVCSCYKEGSLDLPSKIEAIKINHPYSDKQLSVLAHLADHLSNLDLDDCSSYRKIKIYTYYHARHFESLSFLVAERADGKYDFIEVSTNGATKWLGTRNSDHLTGLLEIVKEYDNEGVTSDFLAELVMVNDCKIKSFKVSFEIDIFRHSEFLSFFTKTILD